jgi:RES domain-containing protein
MKIHRMHRSARAAKDYTGAMLAGGRWNPIGTPMLYTAQNLSLACLEILVHLDRSQLPVDYVWSRAELADPPSALQHTDLKSIEPARRRGILG